MQLMANYRPWQLFAVINCAVMLDDQDPKSVKRSNKRFGFGPPGPWDPPDTTRPNKITTMTTTKPIFSVMLNDQDQKSVKGRNKRFGGFANYGGSKYGNDMGDSNPMEWSSWDGWSSCSKTCGTGEQKRIRSCPTICGPENDGVQTKSCNSGLDCPPNYGSWGVWSNCSKSCGDGTNTRSRICNENCDKVVSQNDLYQSGTCYEGECPAESSEWGNWTPCSKTCGEGQRKMTRSCIEFCDTVKPSDLLIIETCKFGDCASEFSTWSVWSPCSLTCGGGQRTKTRSCIKYCSNSDESYLSYTGFCNFADCPNTKFSSWSQWSSCSHTCGEGSKSRDRFCNSNCDNVKSSDLSDTSSCNIRNCLSNSKFSSWSIWSACSHTCGDGHKSRARSCLTNCDNVKSSDLSDTGSCYIRNCRNSKLSSWSVWSSCSHTCGDGYKSRDRSCVAECANATPIDLSDTAVCFAGECPAKFSSWVEWASCSKTCGDGFKTRARFCTALCDNVKPIDLLDSIYCNLGVCASELSSWSVWSSCSTTCGNGDKSRVRSCITNCDNIEPNLLSDTTSCIVVKCPPIFTFWSEWSTCSHRCGYGIETRTRPCIAHCENFNSTDLSESRSCYESICVPQCDVKQLTKPKNAAHWVCNKPIENEAVPKLSKCRIVCLEGYDSIKGKKSLWRNFHRCRKNGLWQKPLDVSISCEPNGDFFNEKFRMAENLNKQYKNDLNFFKTAAQTNNSHLENLQKETASLENTNKNLELKYQTLQNEADNIERETTNLIHETRQLQYECRSMRNESDGLKEKTFSLINNNNYWELEYQTLRNELNYLEQKSYSQSPADKIKLQCQANQTTNYPFQQSENIVLSIVRKEGDSRRSDVCLGLSTNLGVFTSSVCCKADETILYDFENSKEISIESKSFWIEDNICFIKPTESVEFDFRTMEGEIKQLCKIMIYDTSEGYFIQKKIEIEIDDCYKTVCEFDLFSKLHQNQIIMNGTSILCDSSSQLGIITKSYTNTKLIEFVMLSKFNIDKLELYSDDLLEANEQVYEEVPGFESLSQKLQTRTTAFSCRKESDDYDLNLLTNRPLPWVVRVFFQSENTLSGTICSATIIDRYWLVTSKKCCLNKESFKVIFHDENKSQWLFEGKRRVQKCIRKKFCPRMHPREDKNIDICLLELREDVIESGRMNNVLLRSICLPEQESLTGSSCFTSGINRNSKIIDAVPLNLFSYTFCEKHSSYSNFDITLNENQLCAGLPSNNDLTAAFDGKHEEDFGGPLICLDKTKQMPIFTGVASFNSLSTVNGQPGIYTDIFKNKRWIQNMTAAWSQWSECLGSCVTSRRRVCSEQYGCNGLEYEERECPDTSNSCFQPLSDMIDDDLQYCSMLENSKIIKSRNRRVVNGLPVREFWDWLVRLEFLTDNSDLSSLCGGTVIHRNFVLTAAHCCIGKDSVLMNFKDKSRRNVDEKQFQLRSRIFHIYPKYGESDNSQNFDICLIKTAPDDFGMHYDLSKQFEMIPCLPDNIDLQKEHGKECWVAGWGQAQSNGVSSDSLKSIGVNLFDHQYCKDHSYYSDNNEFILNEDELCAGLPHNSRQGKNIKNNYVTAPGKDACQGDSGGPLVCSINEKAILVGVVSHGSGCGEEGKPGIYAKVDFFNDWFKSVIVEPSFVLITNPFENTFKHAIQLNFIDAPRMSDFTINDNTEAYFSCTTVLNGETYVFGGKTKYNQLSKIESCGLKRHGNLPFTSSLYAQIYCGSFKFGKINEKALICRSQQCYSYDGKSMQKSKSTTHVHDGVVMTEYEDEPFIVGDYNHNEIEFMHSTHEKWYTATPFPFTDRLFGYAAVSRPGKVFILGGCCYHDWRKVSVFENDSWNEKGQLKQGRINFSALIYHTDILIIGGISKDQKPVKSESFSLVGSHNNYDLQLPNAMFINGITISLKNSEICETNYIDSNTQFPELIPDPRIYNLPADFTFIHQKWGSFFYKYLGSKTKTEAKQACSQYGESVHLPVPRFTEEQSFYQNHFTHKNLWLDISHEEHGLESSSGHLFTNRFQTFSGVTEISRYDWMNYNASNYPDNRGLILTKSGWWILENESELHESVCVYDVIPDDCSNCLDQGRFCRFKDTQEQKIECLCSNTESTRDGIVCENLCDECQNEGFCKVNNEASIECICNFPYKGDKCEKKGAVLVLSTQLSTNNPMLINANGEIDTDITFKYNKNTEVKGSCAASMNNKMYVFGGINNQRQVSKVANCELKLTEPSEAKQLSFNFVYGVCNTFSFGILLCFSKHSTSECNVFNGHSDNKVASSNFVHGGVGGLGIYRGDPFVTGSDFPSSNSKTEIMNYNSSQWRLGADYPFSFDHDHHHYVVTSTEESVYIFASPLAEEVQTRKNFIGLLTMSSVTEDTTKTYRSVIAEYKNDQWFNVGWLNQPRYAGGAITFGPLTMIIGGASLKAYEEGEIDPPEYDEYDYYNRQQVTDQVIKDVTDWRANHMISYDEELHTEIWTIRKLENRTSESTMTSMSYNDVGTFLVYDGFCKNIV